MSPERFAMYLRYCRYSVDTHRSNRTSPGSLQKKLNEIWDYLIHLDKVDPISDLTLPHWGIL